MDWLVYILIGVGGAGAGSGVTAWLLNRSKPDPIIVKEEVAKEQIEVQKNLTEPDLLEVPCSIDYIKEFFHDFFCVCVSGLGSS